MPGEFGVYIESFKAAATLATRQNRFVKVTAANTVNLAGANEKGIGVLKNYPDAAGKACTVQVLGIAEVVVNAANPNIAAGDWIEVGANGVGVKSTLTKHIVMAQANAAATTDGAIIEVILTGPFTSDV